MRSVHRVLLKKLRLQRETEAGVWIVGEDEGRGRSCSSTLLGRLDTCPDSRRVRCIDRRVTFLSPKPSSLSDCYHTATTSRRRLFSEIAFADSLWLGAQRPPSKTASTKFSWTRNTWITLPVPTWRENDYCRHKMRRYQWMRMWQIRATVLWFTHVDRNHS